jgi:hypothetical protein
MRSIRRFSAQSQKPQDSDDDDDCADDPDDVVHKILPFPEIERLRRVPGGNLLHTV